MKTNLTLHERYIWDHLIHSYPDNMESLPHYHSSLEKYLNDINFSETFDIAKLEIPLHIYLKQNTIPHIIKDELNNLIDDADIILRPTNEEDLVKFSKIPSVNLLFDHESKWDYLLNYNLEDFNVEPGFAALKFDYKGYSFAAISIHPGGNIDVRGPYMISKIYMLKHGNIFDGTSLKGFITGTGIILDAYQIKDFCYYNESLKIWQLKNNNIALEIKVSNCPSNLDYDQLPELMK